MKKPVVLLCSLLVCLLVSTSATEEKQTFNVWRLIANNLSDLKLEISVCATPGCYIRAPRSINTLKAKGVAVYGEDSPFVMSRLIVKDLKSGRQLVRDLWNGQLNYNNTANILSVLTSQYYTTEVWFSDKSGRNVLLGLLK